MSGVANDKANYHEHSRKILKINIENDDFLCLGTECYRNKWESMSEYQLEANWSPLRSEYLK
jgi:hypothetical protein